ncbi:MAG TPA: glycosyltransferase [Chromatiaceae bacterium]|jgi:glycosyltransferase involved in cell wall biosynthesis|nr:glycosyltransferase [Chromatiaceae bacterium]HIN81610.1 glycosyltransferase [Chromatiales bacterium]
MSQPPCISVIMACYNAEAFLRESVDSALGQSWENIELVVVDDGSTDDSVTILREYGDQIRLIEQHNSGPYPARNRGLDACHGEWVAFLDADDYWEPDMLEKLATALDSQPADISYCGWRNIGDNLSGNPPYIPPKYEDGDIVRHFLKGTPWPIHAALIRKSILDQINGFSTRHFSSMDYDLWIRAIAATQNIVLVPEVLAYYRWHDQGQISTNRWKQTLNAWHVRRDFAAANPNLVDHISQSDQHALINGPLLNMAYQTYWKHDLISAQPLFRKAFLTGAWKLSDLKYILPSWLPGPIYRALLGLADR